MEGDPFPQSNPTSMEGRFAVFTEKWIIGRVQVHTIRVTDRDLRVRIKAIPTRGLYGKYEIGIGSLREYLSLGKEIWVEIGYCRWRLFFKPQLIQEVVGIATSFAEVWIYDPADADFDAHYDALMRPLREYERREAPHPDLLSLKGGPGF